VRALGGFRAKGSVWVSRFVVDASVFLDNLHIEELKDR
jgi:hypothetical protein